MESATRGALVNVRQWIGKHKISTGVIAIVAIGLVGSLSPSQSSSAPVATQNVPTNRETTSLSAAQASADFDSVMSTAEKANLVSSYKFSDTERVIYVADVWYTMNVSFKPNFRCIFLASI
jgi:hypothetical protein